MTPKDTPLAAAPTAPAPAAGGLAEEAIDCVLFDLDGTLVDTAPDLAGAVNRLLAEHGRPPLPLQRLRPVCSQGARGIIGRAFGVTPDMAEFGALRDRFLSLYAARLAHASRPFAGVPELLAAIVASGRQWGIVTNKPRAYAAPLVDALGWGDRAAVLVAGDDAEQPKPAPDPLRLACRQLRLSAAACVYVGDDPRDITAARAVPMRNVAVTWGYIEEAPPVADWGAECICDDPAALGRLLDSVPTAD